MTDYMSSAEVAAKTKLSEETIRNEIKRGKLRAIRVGRIYRIPIEALHEWIENCRVRGEQ